MGNTSSYTISDTSELINAWDDMSDTITDLTTRREYVQTPHGHNIVFPSSSSRDDVGLRLYASPQALLVIASLSGAEAAGRWVPTARRRDAPAYGNQSVDTHCCAA